MAPNEYPESEGLQVVPAHEGLQVALPQQGLEVAPNNGFQSTEKKGDPAFQGIEVVSANEAQPVSHKKAATVCGLRRRTFGIIVGIILVVVIVAAVVGGVVGSKHSSSNNSDSPSVSGSTSSSASPTKTGSATATSSLATTTTSTGPIPTTALALDCPKINATTRAIKSSTTHKDYNFNLYCQTNFAPGLDIGGGVNATSLNDCVQGCINLIELGTDCVGVVWDSILNLSIGHNCFFKDSTKGGLLISQSFVTHPAAAILVTK